MHPGDAPTVQQVNRAAHSDGEVLSIEPNASLAAAAAKMAAYGVGALIVLNERGELGGIVTERDIVQKSVAKGLDAEATRVCQIMTEKILTCPGSATIPEAQQMMTVHRIRHLPVVQDGRVVGMISSRDIMARQLDEARQLVRKQGKMLDELEQKHPGISQIQTDNSGRIVI